MPRVRSFPAPLSRRSLCASVPADSAVRAAPLSRRTLFASVPAGSVVRAAPLSRRSLFVSTLDGSAVQAAPVSRRSLCASIPASAAVQAAPLSRRTLFSSIPAGSAVQAAPLSRRSLFASVLAGSAVRAAPRGTAWTEWLELSSTPGAAVARIEGGKLAWTRVLGLRHAARKLPVTEETLFAAASLTKPVVAWVALGLADSKLLDLDRPLHDYVAFAQNERARRVTARHVLSHSTGFPNWRSTPGQALECSFEPGAQFGYSGEGFYLLQRVMEKLTGRSFLALMRERGLGPLGMTSSILDRGEAPDAEFAAAHTRRGEVRTEFKPAPPPPGVEPLPNGLSPNAASSLWTTAADYARFALRAFERNDWFEPRTKINRAISWGLGWGLQQHAGRLWCWHWGDNPGFKNIILCRPSRRDGIVIFTNGDNGRVVYERIVRDVLGVDPPAFLWI